MTLAALIASRKLWRAREVSRYRRWHTEPYAGDRTLFYRLYLEARDMRRRRDREIAKKRKGAAHEMSDAGVALVAQFEGFRAHAYRDPVGVLTQGYGETRGVTPGKPWTEPYARKRLRTRLNRDYVPAVLAAGKGKLKQGAVDGFGSAVYNLGPGVVAKGTTMGNLLRAGKVRAAADALLGYCHAGGRVLLGLLKRRQRERALILR